MNALLQAHLHNHKLTAREMFRAAYQRKFQKDITELALKNDVKQFNESGKVPSYCVDMLIATYGAQ